MAKGLLEGSEVLVVEDEKLFRKRLVAHLEKRGAVVTSATTVQEGRELLRGMVFEFALLDIHLPDGEGLDLLREKGFPETTGVVIMTAEGGVESAVEAMRLGASDYLAKPFEYDALLIAFQRCRAARKNQRLKEHRNRKGSNDEQFFFGQSLAAMKSQMERILSADERLREKLPPVLIEGETGTGKTTVARWLHRNGPRCDADLVEVNCSALPESLAESELFGHERGAFTDARSARIGLFEAAHGGTLFLDEIPSLPPAIQAKVLVAIEDGKVRRVGGNQEISVDVRLIAASNRDLREEVAEGRFREDLFHRLDLLRVRIPPLRERGQDILPLAEFLLEQLCRRYRVPVPLISTVGKRRLLSYAWPGNVRELSHELERCVVMGDADAIDFERLSATGEESGEETAGELAPDIWLNPAWAVPEEGFSLEDAINQLIMRALKETGGNVSQASRRLGVNRDYIRYRQNKFGF